MGSQFYRFDLCVYHYASTTLPSLLLLCDKLWNWVEEFCSSFLRLFWLIWLLCNSIGIFELACQLLQRILLGFWERYATFVDQFEEYCHLNNTKSSMKVNFLKFTYNFNFFKQCFVVFRVQVLLSYSQVFYSFDVIISGVAFVISFSDCLL